MNMLQNFTVFFHTKYSKSGVHFTLRTHLNLDTKFLLEITDMYLNFIKLTVESVPKYLKDF